MNNFKLPFGLPFKFVPRDMSGSHFDDSWYCKQIRSFEIKALYKQKWLKSYTTKLQAEGTLAPDDLVLCDAYGDEVKTFAWSVVAGGTGYNIYETTFDVSDMDDGTYYLYQRVAFGSILWEAVSEPIAVASSYENVMRFKYKNSFNKDDIAWSTGLELLFMCEADIQDFEPDTDEIDYINEVRDTETLYATPSRQFQLYVGDTRSGTSGVAPYMIDILNRVFACDSVYLNDKKFDNKSGSKFKITRVRGYPLIGASLDIVPSRNEQSLEFVDTTPLPDGIITTYNIETGFFGPGAVTPIIEVEENG